MKLDNLLALCSLSSLAAAQTITYRDLSSANVRVDTGQTGPPVEEVHYYYDQWPIGLAVSKQGRIFVCHTRGTYAYTLGEVTNSTVETPYPNLDLNTLPGGLSSTFNGIPLEAPPTLLSSAYKLYT